MPAEQIGRNAAVDAWSRAVVEEIGDPVRAAGWLERLPPGYQDRTDPEECAQDLVDLEDLTGPGRQPGRASGRPGNRLGVAHRLRVRVAAAEDPATFRLRRIGIAAVELTGVLPVFESFGLVVTEAVPWRVSAPAGEPTATAAIDDFGLRAAPSAGGFDPIGDGDRLTRAVDAVSAGAADVDGLNRLVIGAGLHWRQVVILRGYRRYLRQTASPWSDTDLADALAAFPGVAANLVRYFEVRFEPGPSGSNDAVARSERVASVRQQVLSALGAVQRFQQDQVLRVVLGLVDATLRTNWYRRDAAGALRDNLVLKFDSSRVPELPAPRPFVESFVHGPEVEGIHIRNGPIARGGIRWSDRPGDFRTEVLGLAEAQTKKNAIIVPTGAKGGFVVRRRLGGEEVLDAYRAFVAGLLDVTDNVVEGVVRRPAGVVATDGDDPYLVVAADKGTSTYSDDANALSEAYGFWLGDAFASGGSHGYDHKAMGITARGAWVAVRRHFRQLGIDVQTEPIRVAGVGDMSGDVFGNGMLQSRAIKLVAAFDHRHVFIDPDPDPESSYQARSRLASRGRSSWADYDPEAISAGGGIWPRDAKEIALGPEARAALGITAEVLQPPALISAILTAAVDLLWFGGVGTFIKAPDETDAEVGDHANDAVRVRADRVRARVIAEGGNLGITQRGRIRYSRRGGRINTDFIDNAAGVATSDREVNLKILLRLAVDSNRMGMGERDALLAAATNDVAADVLRQVAHSVAALDRCQPDSAVALDAYEALIVDLERAGLVHRQVESLPSAEELEARRSAGAGLIRPELAVLLAGAKSDLVQKLGGSAVVADPSLLEIVVPYFPAAIRARAGDLIARHRLYPQLAATDLAGGLVDSLGVVWAHETSAELGRPLADVAGAAWAARQVIGATRLWAELESTEAVVDADDESALHRVVVAAVTRLARCYLRRIGPIVPSALIDADSPLAIPATRLALDTDDGTLAGLMVDPGIKDRFAAAGRVAALGELAPVVRGAGCTLEAAAAAFDAFDHLPGVNRLRSLLSAPAPARRWSAWHWRAMSDDLADLRRRAAIEAFTGPDAAEPADLAGRGGIDSDGPARQRDPGEAVRRWSARRAGAFDRVAALLDQAVPPADDALTVIALAIRILAGS